MRDKAILSSFLCLVALGVARGGVTYVSQNRSVSASNDRGSSESRRAVDFSPFDAVASVSWEGYSAVGRQTSILTTNAITAEGTAFETGPFEAFEDFFQASSSHFEVVFETVLPERYFLIGDLFAFGDYGGTNQGVYSAQITLSGQDGELFAAAMDGVEGWQSGEAISFNEVFLLEPGRYSLIASASADESYFFDDPFPGVGGGGFADYTLRFAIVPTPSAIVLSAFGAGLVTWLRGRRFV
jgi:hypothetical protein